MFRAQGPDGKTYRIEAPDEASAQQAFQEMFGGGGQDTMAGGNGGMTFDELIPGKQGAPQEQQPQAGPMSFDDVGVSPREQFRTAFDPSQDDPALAQSMDRNIHGEADKRGQEATLGNALTMGAGDEIMGLMAGGLTWAKGEGFSKGYDTMTSAIRGDIANYAERHPTDAMALDIVGSLPSAAIPGVGAAAKAPLAAKMAIGAAGGAAYGGARGYAEGEGGVDQRVESAKEGAVAGGIVGGAVPVAGRAIGKVAGKVAGRRAAPTADAVEEASRALFKRAEDSGVAYKPQALKRLAIVRGTIQGGNRNLPRLNPSTHPNALAALDVLDNISNQPRITFADVMSQRQLLRDTVNAARRGSPDEKFAMDALDAFDKWREALKPRDMIAGNVTGREANQMFNEANRLWAIKKKTDLINDMVFKADADSATIGFEKALRNQFKTLIKNKTRMKAFTPDEQKALREVVKGGPIRKLLSMTNRVMPGPSLGAVASVATGNPIPAVMAGGKSGANMVINKSTRNALGRTEGVVRNGGTVPIDRAAQRASEGYATGLLGTGGQAVAPQLRQ